MSLRSAGSRTQATRTQAIGPLCNVRRLLQCHALSAPLVLATVVLVTGCAGQLSSSGTNSPPAPQAAIRVTPTSHNFGSTVVGKKVSQTVSVANTGNISVNISQANVSGSKFSKTALP